MEVRCLSMTREEYTSLRGPHRAKWNYDHNGWVYAFVPRRRMVHHEFQAVKDWCGEQFGVPCMGRFPADRWCIDPWMGPAQYMFWFRQEHDAIVFRLRWC